MGQMRRREAREERARELRDRPHTVDLRYEKLFDQWRVTLSQNGRLLAERTYTGTEQIRSMADQGFCFTTIGDRHDFDYGLRNGRGRVTLHLTDSQWHKLTGSRTPQR